MFLSCHRVQRNRRHGGPVVSGGRQGGGGSETPTSRTVNSRFPPLSIGVPASLFYCYCEMLCNIAKFFSFSLSFCHFRNPASILSPPTSRTPPAHYSLRLLPPLRCPPMASALDSGSSCLGLITSQGTALFF